MLHKSEYSIPIPNTDLLSWLFDKPSYDLNQPVFIDATNPSQFVTGHQLRTLAKRLAKGLRERASVETRDVVFICSSNTIYYPAFYLGVVCAGATFTGANPAYGEFELMHQLSNSGAKVAFASKECFPLVQKCALKAGIPPQHIFLFENDSVPGFTTYADLLKYGEHEWTRLSTLDQVSNAIVTFNYSSGTTGLPKGCMISHRNTVAHTEQMLAIRDIGNKRIKANGGQVWPESFICFLPFYHGFGQQHHLIRQAKTGDRCYVLPKFDFEQYLSTIQKFGVSSLSFVPPIAVLLAKSPVVKNYDLSSVKYVLAGGAPLGDKVAAEAERAINPSGSVKIRQAWGQSEATMAATWWTWDDPCTTGVGKLCPNVEAKVVKSDGREVGFGERGEFWVRGPNVFSGYWRNPTATAKTITHDGWLRTGDVGYIEPNGVFYMVDREKELIKVNGFQVAPAELEDLLLKCEDVADAAVIGITVDNKEYPRAYIVPCRAGVKDTDIKQFVASRLAPYKRLTGGVVFCESIPKSASGKILRRELRDRAKEEFREFTSERARL
ncbi:acetyl-CoA synthetase-like protein [Hysterangium stoloniferum]|nr:acetyl-CoA synthetase-like protein [Hysterangium stoloniferum]